MAGLAQRNKISERVGFLPRSEQAEGFNVMHAQLLTQFAFRFAANPATVLLALTGFLSALLPMAVYAAFLSKRAVLIIPMLLWVASIITLQAIRYLLARHRIEGLALVRGSFLLSAQLHQAASGAGFSLECMTTLNKINFPAILTYFLNFCTVARNRTKAGVRARLINREHFSAHLAGAINLLAARYIPARTRAVGLRFLTRIGYKFPIAGGAYFRPLIITQSVCQW